MFRVACLSVLVPLLASSAAAPSAQAAPLVDPEVRQAMQDRDYAVAIQAIDRALLAEESPRDYLTFLKGRACHYLERYDDAVQVFDSLAEKYPDSEWARRARLAKAASLARMNDFRSAEMIYRREAAYLLSVDRKEEIADIYLEFARAYFDPDDENQKPDYEKAREFFEKALEAGPQQKGRAEVELLIAQCFQNMNKLDEAVKRYAEFIKKRPDSPWDIEARFRLGQCQLERKQWTDARRTWRDLLSKHADEDSDRIAEATYRLALTHQVPKPPTREDLDLGVAALKTFLAKHPDHELAAQAHLQIAQSYQARGRHEDAAAALVQFLKDARYEEREEAAEGRFLLGQCYQLQENFDQALATWKEYLTKHPAHKRWSEAQRMIVDTEYLIAAKKEAAKQYDEARKLWIEFLAKHPLDGRAGQILYSLGQMNFAQEKWEDALSDWRRLVSKYPGSNPASAAQFMIANTLEEKLGQYDEAIEQYKKVTWGSHQKQAVARIARLTAKRMAIRTQRVFRTNETPRIRLTTRNLEKVTVRCYEIDLETYFRKMHLATGVQSLDIALIDPNRTFEYETPDYEKYKELESDIELPWMQGGDSAEGGVLIVTVSSDTLEATTMVVQSDLDILVKSSRDEVFVFAENMRTGRPWPGVRLLISDGGKVFAEAKTGDDGVFQHAYKELNSAADVRVFAAVGDHTASNAIGLQGLGVSRGLTNKGYLYTDRPAYQPGQMVNVRGVVRRVADDTYLVEEGKKFDLNVLDTRNRLVFQQQVALNRFGSLHCRFVLPPSSPQGQYRILLTDKDKQQYQGAFVVHPYKLESIQLAIEGQRQVYYRGEEIAGKIVARYYYGAPLAGREIRYRLADGPVRTAMTNDHGEVAFQLPTRDYRETQILPLAVELPEYNLHATRAFVLAAQEFSLALSTARPCYLSGETFEVVVKAVDAEGEPTSRSVKLNVLEQTKVNGKTGERLVQEHDARTDKENGEARVTLSLSKGARYTLRAEGEDRFDNPISGQHVVQISGEDDDVRLRILAEKHTYRAGDSPRINVHWREAPALALVAFQGARVLDYRLVDLKTGANRLVVPMTAELAPNFELAISVMVDPPRKRNPAAAPFRRFHTASSPFTVQRDLIVKVEPAGKGKEDVVAPGAPLKVKITAADPQGRPVDAEVSLAMVEQALLDRFGLNVPAIGEFFRGALRQSAVRTTSSITFQYSPTTRPINARLLAETERLAIEKEERERLRELEAEEEEGVELDFRRTLGLHDRRTPESPFGGPALATTGGVRLGERYSMELAPQAPGQAGASAPQRGAWQLLSRRSGGLAGAFGGAGFGYGAMGRAAGVDQPAQQGGQAQAGGPWDESRNGQDLYAGDHVAMLKLNQVDVDQIRTQLQTMSWSAQANGVIAVRKSGAVEHYNLSDLQGADGETILNELKADDSVLLPGLPSRETGYWNPSIQTGPAGSTTVTFTVPDRATSWKLLAKGVTVDTLAGEGESRVVAEKDLFGELKLPAAFTDGDAADITATVHNAKRKKGAITVTLKTTVGGKTAKQTQTIDASAGAEQQVAFPCQLDRPDDAGHGDQVQAVFELMVAADGQEDHFRRAVPIEPYGYPVFGTASGAASSDTTAWVELPAAMPTSSPSLQIVIGSTIQQGLLDVLFGPSLRCQTINRRFTAGSDAAASDLMAAVALQGLYGATRDADNPQAAAIDERIRSSIGRIVSSQRDDGAWSWSGREGDGDALVTARTLWSLVLAARAGYTLPEETKGKAVHFLQDRIAKTASADYEVKAILLHALAAAGQDDFPLANRLHRDRPALSTAALLHLALAMAEMDRAPMAEDVLREVVERRLDEEAPHRKSARGSLPWSHSPAELRALYALALQRVRPRDPKLQTLIDWLMAHRVGSRWSPDKATGPATLAACRSLASSQSAAEHYKLAVFVNDQRVADLEFAKAARTETVPVPAELLKEGKQRVNFRLTGRGRFSYQCIMEAFVAADRLKSTTSDWRIERYYEAAPLERDGKVVPRGFDVLRGGYSSFRNPLTQLPVGRRGRVTLRVWRQGISSETPPEHLEYLVITEPLPCGATVVEDSVKGGFERFEVSPGAITFYVGNRRYVSTIGYDIHGFLPGRYRAAPPLIRDAYRPEQFATHQAASLTVLPLGAQSADPYRLTPRELYELGKRSFLRGEMEEAVRYLDELVTKWNLKEDVFKEATGMLLDANLEIGPARQIVRHFEVVKERWPQMEIAYDKILKIGAAYHDLGEFERAYLIFRATIESSFLTESRVAGFLQSQGELLRSVEVMDDLLREYPPEPYVAAATFDLAQQVYQMAPQAKTDKKLREKKITRVDLIRRALQMLDSFLTAYPNDPGADQAAFSMAAAWLELEQYEPAIDACRRFVRRYADSQDIDGFWYTIGYCHFALGQHQEALETCRKVAEMKRKDPDTGRMVEAENRYRAIYILGQIHHSLGQAAEAIQEYTRVADRFADAKEAIDYFTRRDISLPEVTAVAPGDAVEVELGFRNVAQCEVKAYRIDLMKFSLLQRDLSGITNINLAGIRPYHEETIELGDGKDYRDRKHKLALPLEKEGAYLVVCRGGDLHASGLVLITPLKVEVQEEAASGRVRTTVRDTTTGAYASHVHVKVIGSENPDFLSGQTDLRGVFVADGLRGNSTVIAQADGGRYAFYRGVTRLGPPQPPALAKGVEEAAAAAADAKKESAPNALLEGLYLRNSIIQGKNLQRQQGQYFNDKAGVTVEAVK